MREALFYRARPDAKVECQLCPRQCIIPEGGRGACRVREVRGGVLYTLNYERCSSYALDPIEKKPLYHFYPGSTIFSIGTWGCNFRCQFCQNWQIAQCEPQTVTLTPPMVVKAAQAEHDARCIGVAYTYSEPTVWYEFVLDAARLAREAGLKNVLVTNGFMNPEPLERLLPYIDAFNIDVKAFTPEFYRDLCGGDLEGVKRTVERVYGKAHLEITTLVIPGMNDRPEEIAALTDWIASALGPDVPLHLSRYFPHYRLQVPPTALAILERAREVARSKLRYVYVGNVGGEDMNTHCYTCGQRVIDRRRGASYLRAGRICPACGEQIAIVGEVYYPFRELHRQ